jgi:N-acetylmuramoyl-L-alanine amidase
MIGADGNMVELTRRTAEAAHAGATFFLSVHHDAAQAQFLQPWMWQGIERRYADEFSGFSLFVSRINVNTEVSLKCARAVGMALKTAGFKPSAHHAEKIPGENRPWADQDAGVYYFDDLVVLKTAASPAILIEAGVIINRAEELNIQTPVTRIAFAQAVAKGLSTCGVTD